MSRPGIESSNFNSQIQQYLGRQPVNIILLREPIRQVHLVMKIAEQSWAQERETSLKNGRRTKAINFHTINQFGNIINYTEISLYN